MEERYFLEEKRNGEVEMYETNGAWVDHGFQDLLIATFYKKKQAEKVCAILNETSIGLKQKGE